MLRWALVFAIIALLAGFFGFYSLEATAATVRQNLGLVPAKNQVFFAGIGLRILRGQFLSDALRSDIRPLREQVDGRFLSDAP